MFKLFVTLSLLAASCYAADLPSKKYLNLAAVKTMIAGAEAEAKKRNVEVTICIAPIVMTALATIAGMLPLAFALGAGSQMLQPLAIAVIGGVLISMVLSLIITPAVHYYLGSKGEKADTHEATPSTE